MNIHEFFQKAVNGLQEYILDHYDQQKWFDDWVGLSDIRKYYETTGGSLGNEYFQFDWTAAAYRQMARNWTLYRCPECTVVGEEDVCGNCDTDCDMLTEDEAFEHFRDHKYTIYEAELADSLMIDGWKAFCRGLHPYIDAIKDEALACLTAIANDTDMEDRLVHLMWSLGIEHRNGNIAHDYGELEYWLVDAVRSTGIQNVFGAEDVEKFLRGEYPPIEIDLHKVRKACLPLGEDEWEANNAAKPVSHEFEGTEGMAG